MPGVFSCASPNSQHARGFVTTGASAAAPALDSLIRNKTRVPVPKCHFSPRYPVPKGQNSRTLWLTTPCRLTGRFAKGPISDNSRTACVLLTGACVRNMGSAAGIPSSSNAWRVDYNTICLHSSLGYRPPAPEAILPRKESARRSLPNENPLKGNDMLNLT